MFANMEKPLSTSKSTAARLKRFENSDRSCGHIPNSKSIKCFFSFISSDMFFSLFMFICLYLTLINTWKWTALLVFTMSQVQPESFKSAPAQTHKLKHTIKTHTETRAIPTDAFFFYGHMCTTMRVNVWPDRSRARLNRWGNLRGRETGTLSSCSFCCNKNMRNKLLCILNRFVRGLFLSSKTPRNENDIINFFLYISSHAFHTGRHILRTNLFAFRE